MIKIALDKFETCTKFHEWFRHFDFWPSLFANLGLMGMNAYILHKYFDAIGFHSSGISLVLNVIGVVVGVALYILGAKFCGHGPLYKKFTGNDESSFFEVKKVLKA